jgi:UPF0042 nucleotide-binding protein
MRSSLESHEHRLILITGPSGAGRSTAFHALEDLGYEVIDNLPFTLIPRLIDGPPLERPIALGIDVRNRDFNATAVIELIDTRSRDPRVTMDVLYLDCAPAVLICRYSQTRRRHPLTEAATPAEGIASEIDILEPIRARASHLIDTSEMSPHDLKAELGQRFEPGKGRHLAISIQSFSYKHGLPRGLDMVFDCRFLTNPYWQSELRDKDGRETAVAAHVESDPKFAEFFQRLQGFILMLLPTQIVEGKAYLAIGFGCTGGQHRSVVVVEKLAKVLAEAGWQVSKRHRELERRVAQSAMNEVEGMRA